MKIIALGSPLERPLLQPDLDCWISNVSPQVLDELWAHACTQAHMCLKHICWLEVGVLRFHDCFCSSKYLFKTNEVNGSPLTSHSALLLNLYFLGNRNLFFPNSFAAIGNYGHLMRRADSLEKTLMLGKIEGKRRREQQKMRWLDSSTINRHEFEQTLGDSGQDSLVCCSPRVRHDLVTEQQQNMNKFI